MRAVRTIAAILVAYAAAVVLFEVFLGVVQPTFGDEAVKEWDAPVLITTFDSDGAAQGRYVVPMDRDGQLYVSANHWPRSWYRRALANPAVQVTRNEVATDYVAVPIPPGGAQQQRLEEEHPHPVWFRFLTGYPPRRFLRLDPR